MTEWIGETFTSDVGWSVLTDLVDVGNRMAGSGGERAAAGRVREGLAEYARDARLEEFEIQGWTRQSSRLAPARADGAGLDCIALPGSVPAAASGPFVDLGSGLPRDFEDSDVDGKVVMVSDSEPSWFDRNLHRREKFFRAVRGGAVAFVYRHARDGGLEATGGVDGLDGPVSDVPAVAVSQEAGARLARRYEDERVTVSVEADLHDATSQNVHADLGPDTDEVVLVTSHVDAHDISEGAMDNGAGTAMTVELARTLAAREDELDTRVHFLVFGAEEIGLVGSGYAADRMDHERIKAVVNNDGVVRGRTLACYTHEFDELEDAVRTVADRFAHPVDVNPRMGPHSDHWQFVKHGVPGYMVYSDGDTTGRGWGHTAVDTLDKLEKRTFREQAILLTELVVEVAGDEREIPHKDEAEIATVLEEAGEAEGMKVTGSWPYGE